MGDDVRKIEPPKYTEDDFDLEEFHKKTEIKRRERFFKIHGNTLNLISVLIVIMAFIAAILAFDVANYFIDKYKTKVMSEKAMDIVQEAEKKEAIEIPAETEENSGTQSNATESEIEVTSEPEETPPEVRQNFLNLREQFQNDDIIATINIENTNIAYPVVQYSDNDYYLTRDLNKENNVNGSVFMDYSNSIYPFDDNTVIYGHNMKNGEMFHNIRFYQDKKFYEEHSIIQLNTLYENTEWLVFSTYITKTDFDYIKTKFKDSYEFEEFINLLQEKASYDTGVLVTESDKILTLSTCTNRTDDERYVVHAIRIK